MTCPKRLQEPRRRPNRSPFNILARLAPERPSRNECRGAVALWAVARAALAALLGFALLIAIGTNTAPAAPHHARPAATTTWRTPAPDPALSPPDDRAARYAPAVSR